MEIMPVDYRWLWWVWLGAVGLCFGSFLNVVIYRLPLSKSLVRPGSSCPACGARVRWYDNIPLLSYIFLRGKCRSCKAPISIRYPMIEVLAGALTVAMFAVFGITPQAGINLLLVLAMVAVAFIDAEHMIIPDSISLGGIVVGLGLSFVPKGVVPLDALIGASAGVVFLGLLRWAHMKTAGIEGMGLGDVKLAGTIGAFMGWYSLPMIFLTSALVGLLIGGISILAQRKGARTPLPFGTFLAAATIVYVFIEPRLMEYLYQR